MNASASHPTRVLVVDQDEATREILVQFLKISGFEVLSAATGERALLALREWGRRIDWLFTAVALPGLVDGWIVADEYRAHHPRRAVVHACPPGTIAYPAVEGSIFVTKPVSPIDVLTMFKQLAEADPAWSKQPAVPARALAVG